MGGKPTGVLEGLGELVLSAIYLLIVLGSVLADSRGQPKASALFAFGDSYADTGNLEHSASSWKPPNGVTWPGHPTGRFSNGRIQTDYLAKILGLPTPTPYTLSSVQNIKKGINFALGGSGVTFALGIPPLGTQIDNFEVVLQSGVYSPTFLASSVALVSNIGNDFFYPFSLKRLEAIIELVAEGVAVSLGRLYTLGFRNVLLASLPPLSCLPSSTIASNYTACTTATDPLILLYNGLVEKVVANLSSRLVDANFITLDELKAFNHVLENFAQYGITEFLVPCCKPITPLYKCGDVDRNGNPLFTVCKHPASHIYWDENHPVESTWKIVVDLINFEPGYVIGAPSLEVWLLENSLQRTLSQPAPTGLQVNYGAIKQLETAFNALIFKADYSEAIGLLQDLGLGFYLTGLSEQRVTLFLPNNEAFFSISRSVIEDVYGNRQELEVVGFHAVKEYRDRDRLKSTRGKNLTTISGLPLLVTSTPKGLLIGPQFARIVNPDLYNVEGLVVIHGIDKILFPPVTIT